MMPGAQPASPSGPRTRVTPAPDGGSRAAGGFFGRGPTIRRDRAARPEQGRCHGRATQPPEPGSTAQNRPIDKSRAHVLVDRGFVILTPVGGMQSPPSERGQMRREHERDLIGIFRTVAWPGA